MVHTFIFDTADAYLAAYTYLSTIGAPFKFSPNDDIIVLDTEADPYWDDEIYKQVKFIYDSEVDKS